MNKQADSIWGRVGWQTLTTTLHCRALRSESSWRKTVFVLRRVLLHAFSSLEWLIFDPSHRCRRKRKQYFGRLEKSAAWQSESNVHSAFWEFWGLLYEGKIAGHLLVQAGSKIVEEIMFRAGCQALLLLILMPLLGRCDPRRGKRCTLLAYPYVGVNYWVVFSWCMKALQA